MIFRATTEDLDAINAIYNQAVKDGLRTAHLKPVDLEERKEWFREHEAEAFPVFVWKEDNDVLGWISVSPYRAGRQALDDVAEISYYIDYRHHGKGLATALMEHAISFCRDQGFRILVAILISGNEASIGLLEKFGFEEYGRIPDGIRYQDTLRDHLYMGLRLD